MQAGDVIAVIAAVIAAVSAFISVWNGRGSWRVGTISAGRFEWSENVRKAISCLIDAYYIHDSEVLNAAKSKALLYFNPNNNLHREIVQKINSLNHLSDEDEVQKLVEATQELLHKYWWIVKAETTFGLYEEDRAQKKAKKYLNYLEKHHKQQKV